LIDVLPSARSATAWTISTEQEAPEMTDVTLEAMIRRISREAERMFNRDGGIDMLWLLDAPDEGLAIVASPFPEGTDADAAAAKDDLVAGMREFFRERNVTRYARACEVWVDEVPKAASELRDDEGRVFVTDVPGSPFQIMGWRNPRTDDLCVSGLVCVAYEEHRAVLDNPECPPPFEVVTGPEANDLINAFEIGPDGQPRPRRVERVMIDGEDGSQYLMAFRNIVRPVTGKPYLTPLSKIERPNAAGPFLGLLPKNGFSQ
jgi:hypothetical protein